MLDFRDNLHSIIDNGRWENTLSEHKLYDDNLIIFFGDSQIALWWISPSFGVLPIANRGLSGDWTLNAIYRFDRDVISQKPKILVLLIGTNDLGHNQPIDSIISNIDILIKRAINNKITVILCGLLPVRNKYIHTHPPKNIIHLNRKLELLARHYKIDYVDFYSHLLDDKGLFDAALTSDGLHPSRSGYLMMSKILFPYLMKNIIAKKTVR
jgi:lysophospholipase L1-like esterase